MAKAKDKVVVELNVNSGPPAKFSDDRRGYVLSKTQAALCAIDNSAFLESYASADSSDLKRGLKPEPGAGPARARSVPG